ncbi:hypothetical protein SCHPADRAFT_902948 [Schizopora paradoxa]|uniref:Mitochondrial ribosomal protein subunit L20-domain-containing protein n=1 Tax=Schizopora paradoxa TaxID=27342 RepID=A0A0H2RS34_9AGAM|nr:hypothetical protein SCHPADRAFT_902948 [Schizopora paradoxa]
MASTTCPLSSSLRRWVGSSSSSIPKAHSSRTYATRRPEKPPARFPDPLTSTPDISAVKLPDGVTFFRRPPPSAPTPLSTTLDPSSPLLRPLSTSTSAATSNETEPTTTVPPRLHTPRVFPSNQVLSDADFEKMRQLRAEQPEKYTRGRLAKMFNCAPFLVGQMAPLESLPHKDALEKREKLHEEVRSQWGERKQLIRAIRKKRREFW